MCNWQNFGSNGYIEQPKEIRTSFIKRFFDTKKSVQGGQEKYIIRATSLDDIWFIIFLPEMKKLEDLIPKIYNYFTIR